MCRRRRWRTRRRRWRRRRTRPLVIDVSSVVPPHSVGALSQAYAQLPLKSSYDVLRFGSFGTYSEGLDLVDLPLLGLRFRSHCSWTFQRNEICEAQTSRARERRRESKKRRCKMSGRRKRERRVFEGEKENDRPGGRLVNEREGKNPASTKNNKRQETNSKRRMTNNKRQTTTRSNSRSP